MENKLSPQYGKALELHNKILVSAQLAQNSLWEMCAGLKEMRDGKLYKELGYKNFEDYCGAEFNINRTQAHKYISILENIKDKNVYLSKHFGVTKLYLLSTLSESEQEKITAENDVESMTVKQLEKEIRELKSEKLDLEQELDDYAKHINGQDDYIAKLKGKAMREEEEAAKKISSLEQQVRELEARPIEVAVAEPTDEVRQLKLTIKNLERTSEEQLDRVQEEHIAAERRLREKHAQELEIKLDDQAKFYEQKLADMAQQAETSDRMAKEYEKKLAENADDRQVFKAYFTAAFDTFNRMLEFAKQSADKPFFKEKINNLITTLTTANENM